jgi:hypothetical protein
LDTVYIERVPETLRVFVHDTLLKVDTALVAVDEPWYVGSITDWLEACGAIVAFVTLYFIVRWRSKDDEERVKELRALSAQSRALVDQSKILNRQTRIMDAARLAATKPRFELVSLRPAANDSLELVLKSVGHEPFYMRLKASEPILTVERLNMMLSEYIGYRLVVTSLDEPFHTRFYFQDEDEREYFQIVRWRGRDIEPGIDFKPIRVKDPLAENPDEPYGVKLPD